MKLKILIENYKSKEINLFYNGCIRNELIKLWKDCLIDLNDINIITESIITIILLC